MTPRLKEPHSKGLKKAAARTHQVPTPILTRADHTRRLSPTPKGRRPYSNIRQVPHHPKGGPSEAPPAISNSGSQDPETTTGRHTTNPATHGPAQEASLAPQTPYFPCPETSEGPCSTCRCLTSTSHQIKKSYLSPYTHRQGRATTFKEASSPQTAESTFLHQDMLSGPI